MIRFLGVALALTTMTACGPSDSKAIEFLTREGCAQTTVMRAHLDGALDELKRPKTYPVVDLDSLPSSDPRRGYPTPTVLVGGIDLFDMPAPTPPYPEPT